MSLTLKNIIISNTFFKKIHLYANRNIQLLLFFIKQFAIFYSMDSEARINMSVLRSKLAEGLAYIQKNVNEKEAIFFLGDTGVGKSTILNYLIGNELKIEEVGLKPCLLISNPLKQKEVKIGHQKISQTRLPIKIISQGLAIYDCPGFNDNKSKEAEIANSFYYQRLISLYEKIKIVIVVDQSFITESRAHRMPALIKSIQNSFGTLENLQMSTLFVINKCSPDCTDEELKKQFRNLVETKNLFSQDQLSFFNTILAKNQIFSLKQPKRSEIGHSIGGELRAQLFEQIKKLSYMDHIEVKNIISDAAKLAIRDYVDILRFQSESNVCDLMHKIKQNTLKVNVGGLYQAKQQVIKLLSYKNLICEQRDFGPFFDFCLQRKIDCNLTQKLKSHLSIVEFFSKVYTKEKTESFYLNISNLIINNFSLILQKVNSKIEDQKIESERKKQRKIREQELNALQFNKQNKTSSLGQNKSSKQVLTKDMLKTQGSSNIFDCTHQ